VGDGGELAVVQERPVRRGDLGADLDVADVAVAQQSVAALNAERRHPDVFDGDAFGP